MSSPIPTTAISTGLLAYLKEQYRAALMVMVNDKDYHEGINGYTEHAIPAYIIAVTTVETFVNEMLLGPVGQMFSQKPESEGFWKALEAASLADKLIFAPEFHFGRTFLTDEQPYQDMNLLIKLRNFLVHYKMDFDFPKPVKDLQQRGIALNNLSDSWTSCISTTEGIRWAHNTVCETLKKIISFADESNHPILARYDTFNIFNSISEVVAQDYINRLLTHKQGAG
jgi:hypothetical protein